MLISVILMCSGFEASLNQVDIYKTVGTLHMYADLQESLEAEILCACLYSHTKL